MVSGAEAVVGTGVAAVALLIHLADLGATMDHDIKTGTLHHLLVEGAAAGEVATNDSTCANLRGKVMRTGMCITPTGKNLWHQDMPMYSMKSTIWRGIKCEDIKDTKLADSLPEIAKVTSISRYATRGFQEQDKRSLSTIVYIALVCS
jgi:hypothetical protein